MPVIRILNWNIEKLSVDKTNIPGMAANLGQVIVNTETDIAIILEVVNGSADAAMSSLSKAANTASIKNKGAATDYTTWFTSYSTGGERYGVLIKDINTIRPVEVSDGPEGSGTSVSDEPLRADAFLTNLNMNRFATWPGTFANLPNAYNKINTYKRCWIPLTDVYVNEPPSGRVRKKFSGQKLVKGGYALGNGFRMPALMMFEVQGAANYLISILACHYGAVRSGSNTLARGQVEQLRTTHIAQKFVKPQNLQYPDKPTPLPANGYIVLNGALAEIQELIVTGDFNIDFMDQSPPGPKKEPGLTNRTALNSITPTLPDGGSVNPAASPGAPAGQPNLPTGTPFGPKVNPRTSPFDPPYGNNWPIANDNNLANMNLALKTANTASGTILHHFDPLANPQPQYKTTVDLRGANFDNIFYGGTQLSPDVDLLHKPEACHIHDLPKHIEAYVKAKNNGYGIASITNHYLSKKRKRYAPYALNTTKANQTLNLFDRLIAARFISDHLPVYIEVNLQ